MNKTSIIPHVSSSIHALDAVVRALLAAGSSRVTPPNRPPMPVACDLYELIPLCKCHHDSAPSEPGHYSTDSH